MKIVGFAASVAVAGAALVGCIPPVSKAVVGPVPAERGQECRAACTALGMQLSQVVLIMNSAGCVCQVPPDPTTPGAAPPSGGASAAAGGAAIAATVAAERARADQERRRKDHAEEQQKQQQPQH